MNLKYLNDTPWLKEYVKAKSVTITNYEPQLIEIESGYILPTRQSSALRWGAGGVIDQRGEYVSLSGIPTAFGEKYDFDREEAEKINETVIFIGIIPKQVGHFFIDSICRYWYLLREESKKYRIAYCSYHWDSYPIEDKYAEVFSLLEIDSSRLIHITKPTSFSKILIPEATMTFGGDCNTEYKTVINKLIEAALRVGKTKRWSTYKKIYFNKRFYFPANMKQVGELQIEKLFERNGFQVLSPEKLTLTQMIFLINNCEIMASLSGTTSHYSMFSGQDFQLISLNRLPEPLLPQIRIDALFGINDVFVDCYNKQMLKKANVYGTGVIWVELTDKLVQFARDNDMELSTSEKNVIVKIRNTAEYHAKNVIYHFIPLVKRLLGR